MVDNAGEATSVMNSTLMPPLADGAHAYHFGPLIERLLAQQGVDPESRALDMPIRFHSSADLGFACADVRALRRDDSHSLRLEVAFFGLHGCQSPLPGYYLDELAWQSAQQQPQLIAVLDLLHHRWLTLLYLSWRKYRHELRFRAGGTDPISRCLLAMLGAPVMPLQAEQWLANYRFLMSPARSAGALCSLIRQSFDLPEVQLHPWQRRQVSIAHAQQNRLGQQAATLGGDCLLGSQVADCASKFCLSLTRLTHRQFRRLLPDGDLYRALKQLIALQLHDLQAWDLELELARDEAPRWQLGCRPDSCLGWSNFVGHPHPTPSLRLVVEE
jgi:type VI secretion system protein ImpH